MRQFWRGLLAGVTAGGMLGGLLLLLRDRGRGPGPGPGPRGGAGS